MPIPIRLLTFLTASLSLLVAGCSSGDPDPGEENIFDGPFEGTVSATFQAAGGTTVQSDYTIRLDLNDPNPSTTRFVGTLRIERHASAAGPQAVGTGDVFGLTGAITGGSDISISTDPHGSGQGFQWAVGGAGTISADGKTIQLPQATVGDPLLGNSQNVSMTLR